MALAQRSAATIRAPTGLHPMVDSRPTSVLDSVQTVPVGGGNADDSTPQTGPHTTSTAPIPRSARRWPFGHFRP